MTLFEMTKKFGEGKGEDVMWSTLKTVSEAIEQSMDEKAKDKLMRDLYGQMAGGHYNQEYAMADVQKMYYVDAAGMKHQAPYWTEAQVREVYESVKKELPPHYNFWDFYVALQMQRSDSYSLIKKWYPNATPEELDKKLVDMAVNWLNDPDNPYRDHKIWGYMCAK
jgi:hypothetical protein